MKQKMRERVRPKMGKIDIDYQKLHDAFFRWQIKPKMTIHGDLYYEVRQFLHLRNPGWLCHVENNTKNVIITRSDIHNLKISTKLKYLILPTGKGI